MRASDVVRTALHALLRHKLRSSLTMLGIAIGVGATITSVAIGQGAANQIQDQIASMGENMIWVEAGSRNVNGVRSGTHGTASLTVDDERAIREHISLVEKVSPNVDARVTVIYQNQNWLTQVRGVGPDYFAIRRWTIQDGSGFSDQEVQFASKICVLGSSVVANLFGEQDPIGQVIRVQRIPCRVIGVLASKGPSPTGQDQDDVVIMPFTTVQKRVKGVTWLDDVYCSAVSPEGIEDAEREISALLRQRHHIGVDQDDDFNLRHPVDIARASAAAQRTMTLLLAAIGSVALVVGGVGILNIMLVSVSERTREIGLRLAVGARERDILAQFLLEAVVLSAAGGLFGVGLGLAGATGVACLGGWPTVIGTEAIVLALGTAGTIGAAFGLYPARRAARLDPVDALAR
jgi:putative ABC transport system permease protein